MKKSKGVLIGLTVCFALGLVYPISGSFKEPTDAMQNNRMINETKTAPAAESFGARRVDTSRFLSPAALQQKTPAGPIQAVDLPDKIQALVVPHHGLAAEMAAEAIALWGQAETKPTAVIILGPNHVNKGPQAATTNRGWQTSEGTVDGQQEIIESLLDKGLVKEADELFDTEHSIGVLMPWLAKYLPGTPVVPLIFHYRYPENELETLLAALKPWLDNGAVILMSIDFSHGLTMEEAEKKDRQMTQFLLENNDQKIKALDSTYLDGPTLLSALMKYYTEQGQKNPYILSNTNAGRLMKNSRCVVTSYFTLAFNQNTTK